MGFNTNEIYQTESNWLKAADLQRQEHTVLIENVTMATVKDRDSGRDQHKLELHFQGRDKTLLLNKTNADAIAYAYGPDTDGWIAKHIVLYPTMVPFGDRNVEAIRVRPVLPQAEPPQSLQQGVAQVVASSTPPAAPNVPNDGYGDPYDDIDSDVNF